MTNYHIFLNGNNIATVADINAAYACFEAAKTIAEMTESNASLVWEDGEVIDYYDFNEPEDYEPADIDDDCGFDPYEGCYTYDC